VRARNPFERLSDQGWVRFMKATGLPDQARENVELDIAGFFLCEEAESRALAPDLMRRQIRACRSEISRAIRLLVQLNRIECVRQAMSAAAAHEGSNLHQTSKPLYGYWKLLGRTESLIPSAKRGPKNQGTYWLIFALAGRIQQYTGRLAGRSDGSYQMFIEIFSILGRRVTRGTIDEALRTLHPEGTNRLTRARDSNRRSVDNAMFLDFTTHGRSNGEIPMRPK